MNKLLEVILLGIKESAYQGYIRKVTTQPHKSIMIVVYIGKRLTEAYTTIVVIGYNHN